MRSFWDSAPIPELMTRLGSPDLTVDLETAVAIRERSAALLHASPADAYSLSRLLLRAVRSSPRTTGDAAEAVAWRSCGEACIYTGRLGEARSAYDRAAEKAAQAEDSRLLGQILVGRVHVLALSGRPRESAACFRAAERLLRKTQDRIYLGKLYMNHGNALYQQEQYAGAFENYERAWRALNAAGQPDPTLAALRMNQAVACTQLSRLEEADRLFLETEELARRSSLGFLESHARFNRALLERLRGNYRDGLSLISESAALFERQDARDMVAASEQARAEIYLELGMPPEAGALARDAARRFRAESMTIDEHLSRQTEASALVLSGDPSGAAELLEECAGFFDAQGIRTRKASVVLDLARCELKRHRPGVALELARRALRVFETNNAWRSSFQARLTIGEAHLAREHPALAERRLRPLFGGSRPFTFGERFRLWSLAGRIAEARGDDAEARRRYRAALRSLEAQRELIPGTEVRARAFESQVETYHRLIALTLNTAAPRFDVLFRLTEAARARAFRDRLVQLPTGVRPATARRRAHLSSLTRRLEESELAPATPRSSRERAQLRQRIRSLERELAEEVRRSDLKGGRADRLGDQPSAAVLVRRMPAGRRVVSYFALDSGAVLTLVIGRGFRQRRILPASTTAIRRLVDRARFQLETAARGPELPASALGFQRKSTEKALAEVFQAVVAPLADLLPDGEHVTFVPHRFLHEVPFECLHDGRDYIDSRWTVSRAPSAGFIARKRPHRGRGPVVVAGVELKELPAVLEEVRTVASFFPARDVHVLKNPDRGELLRRIPGARLLHLSTHGLFREDNPAFSRLRTRDGSIFVADITEQPLAADLVVLSACESGRVFTGRADELSGVAHAFLAAGARCLVASQRRVQDEVTHAVMGRFYEAYVSSGEADAAGSMARAVRQVRTRWNHPVYWGAFSVLGG